jgi:hypothetical protein
LIPLTVSLTGDFDDIDNSVPYRYFSDPEIFSMYPKHGRANGGTRIEIRGNNLISFEATSCTFGTVSVKAQIVDDTHMVCFSPPSDVLGMPVPLSLTFNGGEIDPYTINYFYHQMPTINKVLPITGPMSGGYEIAVLGNNLDPFTTRNDIYISQDIMCDFQGVAITPARVVNNFKAYCMVPPAAKAGNV